MRTESTGGKAGGIRLRGSPKCKGDRGAWGRALECPRAPSRSTTPGWMGACAPPSLPGPPAVEHGATTLALRRPEPHWRRSPPPAAQKRWQPPRPVSDDRCGAGTEAQAAAQNRARAERRRPNSQTLGREGSDSPRGFYAGRGFARGGASTGWPRPGRGQVRRSGRSAQGLRGLRNGVRGGDGGGAGPFSGIT